MQTTINIDDELWNSARDYADILDSSELVRKALKEMVAREAMRRLIALGGTMPDAWVPSRNRGEDWTPDA